MDEKIYLIYKEGEGEYEDYRERLYIEGYETAGQALDRAIELGLVITDDQERFNRDTKCAFIMKGVFGKSAVNFE